MYEFLYQIEVGDSTTSLKNIHVKQSSIPQ